MAKLIFQTVLEGETPSYGRITEELQMTGTDISDDSRKGTTLP